MSLVLGKRIYLQQIGIEDCNDRYLSWMNDPVVNRYLETRWKKQTLETLQEFVTEIPKTDSVLFKIMLLNSQEPHVGNIKLGPINRNHHYADVSYFIGDKDFWGCGISTEAVQLVTKIGFERFSLERLQAGVYASNKGSIRVLEKSGYKLEAVFKNKLVLDDTRDDHLIYSIMRERSY